MIYLVRSMGREVLCTEEGLAVVREAARRAGVEVEASVVAWSVPGYAFA